MKIIIVLIIVLLGLFFANLSQEAKGERKCEDNHVCVFPGDFIKFHVETSDTEATETSTFSEFVSQDEIQVKSVTIWKDGTVDEIIEILDLKTGLTDQLQPDDSCCMPFVDMIPVPIKYDQNERGVYEKTQIFKGMPRTVIVSTDDPSSAEIRYDKETGILMYMYLRADVLGDKDLGIEPYTIYTKSELIDTNIFQDLGISVTQLQIPTWIKNNAKWWSDGKISDSDFVQGIQYLIKQGRTKIPETTSGIGSSQQIPAWIKSNAGWWADGKISDSDFVSGIQYLISNGIMKIG